MIWSINLGQSVLVPYQLSASSYATARYKSANPLTNLPWRPQCTPLAGRNVPNQH